MDHDEFFNIQNQEASIWLSQTTKDQRPMTKKTVTSLRVNKPQKNHSPNETPPCSFRPLAQLLCAVALMSATSVVSAQCEKNLTMGTFTCTGETTGYQNTSATNIVIEKDVLLQRESYVEEKELTSNLHLINGKKSPTLPSPTTAPSSGSMPITEICLKNPINVAL